MLLLACVQFWKFQVRQRKKNNVIFDHSNRWIYEYTAPSPASVPKLSSPKIIESQKMVGILLARFNKTLYFENSFGTYNYSLRATYVHV